MADNISPKQFHEAPGTQDWRVIGDGACAFYHTSSLVQSAQLVAAVANMPGLETHKPDIDVRPDGVTFRLLSKSADWYGMTSIDVDVARAISGAAQGLGLTGDPSQVQSFLVVPGGVQPCRTHAVLAGCAWLRPARRHARRGSGRPATCATRASGSSR